MRHPSPSFVARFVERLAPGMPHSAPDVVSIKHTLLCLLVAQHAEAMRIAGPAAFSRPYRPSAPNSVSRLAEPKRTWEDSACPFMAGSTQWCEEAGPSRSGTLGMSVLRLAAPKRAPGRIQPAPYGRIDPAARGSRPLSLRITGHERFEASRAEVCTWEDSACPLMAGPAQ
jgi:hypothetical protein